MKASGAAPDPSIEDMPLEDPSGALSIPPAWKPSGAQMVGVTPAEVRV